MLEKILDKIRAILANPKLKSKLLFTLAIFALTRVLVHIPVPAVDLSQLKFLFASNQFLNFLNIFSGGTLSRLSIAAVGINPYITASIIMQLLGMIVPKIKEMQKEGEASRAKLNQYMRLMSVPIAIVQAVSVIALLNSQNLLISNNLSNMIIVVTTLVAGSVVMMWLGELINEKGIGNGTSMILLAGIVSQAPSSIASLYTLADTTNLSSLLMIVLLFLAVISLVVFMNEATRKVPIQYAKRIRGGRQLGGQQTHLPIKVNVAGVMPLIFAVSLMMIPSFVGKLLTLTKNPTFINIGEKVTIYFANTSAVYLITYFVLVFVFSYFSAIIFFNAQDISDELKKSGAFIPGIRPG
ncbi:MAG TPA: preprotein translocase subunit SecY, partial [Candidatus Woesebacteria bacterium]|nr:preprotein translocase subunit SecY [Candidatus Woesebacteria bacterium]